MGDLRLAYVNVFVSDMQRAVEFYQQTLGLELKFTADEHGYASFASSGLGFGLARVEAGSPLLGQHTGIGWAVSDLEASYAELRSKGVHFTMPPTQQPWGGFMAMFADPDGNVFYLDQRRDA
jgi:predicted enzyme related to lactoylglutathione lyase